jgi:hypothetical protein
LALAGVVLLLIVSLAPARNAPGAPDDEGLLLVYPEQVLNGAIPNRDYETFYGPGDTYLLAGVYEITGPKIGVERAIGLTYRVAIVGAIFGLAAFDGVLVGLAAGLLSTVVFTSWDFTWIAFGWLGAVALALLGLLSWLIALRATSKTPRRWLICAGALVGFAVFVRFDLLPAVALAALPLLIVTPKSQRRCLAVGLVLPGLALATHLALAGVGHVASNVWAAIFRSGAQARLPFPAVGSAVWWNLVLVGGTPLLLILAGLLLRRRGASAAYSARLTALGLFSLGLFADQLHRIDYPHLMFAGCVSVGLLPVALVSLIRSFPGRVPISALVAGTVAGLLAVYGLATNMRHVVSKSIQPTTWVTHRGRSWPTWSLPESGAINETLAAVERRTKPGQKLFVGPDDLRRTNYNDIYFYWLLPQLRPASYYIDMNPGTANRSGSRLATDIASADVLLLTIRYDSIWRDLMPYSRLGSDVPNEVVAHEFRLQGAYGPFRVYLRR